MGVRHHLDTDEQLQHFLAMVSHMRLAGKPVCVEFVQALGNRTPSQNRAMHMWFDQLATDLNEAGLDARTVIKEEVAIDWTPEMIKDCLWRPVMTAMTGKESTTELTKTECGDIYDTIVRHLAGRFGVPLPPWPTYEG